MSRNRLFAIVGAAGVLIAARGFAGLDGSYMVPLDDPAIHYADPALDDPVTRLQGRLDRGEAKLAYDPKFGYLPSVLRNLGAPVSSQMLVFSKTSFQAPRIHPRSPRAIYFTDDVAVGFVRDGEVVELASVDPSHGAVFFTLDQEYSKSPQFVRRDDCLQCHVFNGLGVPGFIIRSVHTDAGGMPISTLGGFLTDHRSPLKDRWGGWYVTGTHGGQRHMGNFSASRTDLDRNNVTSLAPYIDTDAYLAPHSDIVALMTIEHQARMQNLITRAGYEARLAIASQQGLNKMNQSLSLPVEEFSETNRRLIDNAAEALVGYMLFTDETPLEAAVKGTSAFAAEFQKRGPRDRRGRSLREFDLTRRMFRFPCSYLIYSQAFDRLPDPVRERIYQRLWEVLTGKDQSKPYQVLSAEDRRAIFEILLDTKPEFRAAGATRRTHSAWAGGAWLTRTAAD